MNARYPVAVGAGEAGYMPGAGTGAGAGVGIATAVTSATNATRVIIGSTVCACTRCTSLMIV
jgi:hypothetical protein